MVAGNEVSYWKENLAYGSWGEQCMASRLVRLAVRLAPVGKMTPPGENPATRLHSAGASGVGRANGSANLANDPRRIGESYLA